MVAPSHITYSSVQGAHGAGFLDSILTDKLRSLPAIKGYFKNSDYPESIANVNENGFVENCSVSDIHVRTGTFLLVQLAR